MIAFLVNALCFVLFVFIGSLIMCGWYKSTREKMIFEFWSKFWETKVWVTGSGSKSYFNGHFNSKREEEEFTLNGGKIKYKFGKFAHPISGCVYCYSSIYGSLIYWIGGYALLGSFDFRINAFQCIVLWIMYMLCCVSMNGIIIKKVL